MVKAELDCFKLFLNFFAARSEFGNLFLTAEQNGTLLGFGGRTNFLLTIPYSICLTVYDNVKICAFMEL